MTTQKTLLSIGEEIRALEALIDQTMQESDGELSPELEKVFDAWFAELSVDRNKKVDGYCSLMRERELTATLRQSESDRLHRLARSDRALADRLKMRLKLFMLSTNQPDIKTDRFSVRIQNNGGNQTIHLKMPVEELPDEYQRVTVSPDMDKIRADLLAGNEKAQKIAEFEPRGKQLRIS